MVSILRRKVFNKFFDFLARVFISSIFISSIPPKISQFSKASSYIYKNGIPEFFAPLFLIASIILLTLGSGFFIFQRKKNFGALILLAIIIPTTIIFHLDPFQQQIVLMNISLIGALILSITRN